MILLQTSHAENTTSPNCDEYDENPDWAHWPDPDCLELPKCLNLPSSFRTCKNCGGKINGHDNLMMVCVPSYFKQSLLHPPYSIVPMKDGKWNWEKIPLTDIMINIRNIEVIGIGTDTHTITISMNFAVRWFDYRLKVWNYPPKEYWAYWMYLSTGDFENIIWSPHIDIANNMVSKKKQDEKFVLWRSENNSIPLVTRQYYLSTSVTCEMDFQNFPFDKHDCNLEVSRYILSF